MKQKKNKKTLIVLLLLLVAVIVAGVVWFITLPQQQTSPIIEPVPTSKPVVLTEQDKWFDNLEKLNTMAYPKFTCNTFVNQEATLDFGDEDITDYFDHIVSKSDFRFVDELPSDEELFPVIVPGEQFERCSLNIPVDYLEETSSDGSVFSNPDLSSVDGVVAAYDLGPNEETISWNVYPTGDNMADAVQTQIFLTNLLGLENEIVEDDNGVTVSVDKILSIAFSTKEDLYGATDEELEKLRSAISEEQFLILNNSLINIL